MNIMTQCLCIFALIGLIDKFMGNHMAFIAGLEPPHILTIYAVNKAIAGVTAALLALWITRSYISKDSRSSGTSKLPE